MKAKEEKRFGKEEVWKDIAFLLHFRPSPPSNPSIGSSKIETLF